MRFRLIALSLLLVCSAAEASVDGSLTANGKTFPLKFAVAQPKKNPFDKKKTDTVIVFSDQELSAAAASDDIELMQAVDKMSLSGFMVEIDGDKSVISGEVFSPAFKKMKQFSAVGMQKVELTTMTPTHVAGSVTMAKPDDFFGNVYEYHATFDLPVGAAAPSVAVAAPKGKALPANGGDPGKAYAAYLKVFTAGDVPALKKAVSGDRAKEMDSKEFKEFFPVMQAMQPKNIKVTGGAIDGETATLLASAKNGDEVSNGTVTMVREGGVWKVQKESWKSRSE
jgi:hypothetical protein